MALRAKRIDFLLRGPPWFSPSSVLNYFFCEAPPSVFGFISQLAAEYRAIGGGHGRGLRPAAPSL
jgi:hypothetical protein